MSIHDNDTCPHLVRASLLEAENARLKADVERLTKELKDEKSANTNVEGRMQSANRCLSMANHTLKAEVERLTAMANECEHLHKGIYSLSLNVVQLKDEVERLRKAGDAMADNLYIPVHHEIYLKLLTDWNAAKEGKPSV